MKPTVKLTPKLSRAHRGLQYTVRGRVHSPVALRRELSLDTRVQLKKATSNLELRLKKIG